LDEAHRVKNRSSVIFEKLKLLDPKRRLLLTGTPLQNNLNELWALLSFILPGFFNDEQQFSDWFNRPFENDSDDNLSDSQILSDQDKQQEPIKLSDYATNLKKRKSHKRKRLSVSFNRTITNIISDSEKALIISSLHRVLKPFILRRLKSDVARDLPDMVCINYCLI
jgi:SNF2 family DNA or RNA helicase